MSGSKIPVSERALAELCQRFGVRRLSLFGSVVRDDFGPESDVDVLIEFAPEAGPTLFTLERLRRDLSELYGGRAVDVVTPASLHPALRDRILKSAVELYAA